MTFQNIKMIAVLYVTENGKPVDVLITCDKTPVALLRSRLKEMESENDKLSNHSFIFKRLLKSVVALFN
jgi:hypothetical protein